MADSKPMRESDLAAIVAAKIASALGRPGDALSGDRVKAEQYYKGEPFGNEQDGRSKVVSRDVAEAVDAMMPPLLKIFSSGDEVVRFEPTGPEDEESAKQATDYVNWIWNQQNDGFSIFHTWFKDALLKKAGVIKIWWDSADQEVKDGDYVGLTDDEVNAISKQEDVTRVVTLRSYPDPSFVPPPAMPMLPGPVAPGMLPPPAGAPVAGQPPVPALMPPQMPPAPVDMPPAEPPTVHDVTVYKTKSVGCVKVMAVPPDEFLIDRRAAGIDGTDLGHRRKYTISELRGLFPKKRKQIDNLDAGDDGEFDQERIERFSDEGGYTTSDTDGVMDPATRQVWVTEFYVRADFDGDGVAELRKVTVAGSSNNLVLDNEEVDDHPFAALTPIPMPHKFYGMSIADQTMDLQLIKSTLFRGMLDSLYLQNAPQMGAVEGQVNLDDLLNRRPGGVVRMKSPGALVPIATQPVAADALQGIAYLDTVREQRTGVQRFTAGPGADALNSAYTQTATGAGMVENASQERLELIARNFAETGVKRAFRRILELVCQHQDKAKVIRLRGKWVEMDPREWSTRMDMSVNVGLGTGNKQQQIAAISNLLLHDQQIIAIQGGLHGPLVTAENVYNKFVKLVEASGLRSPDPYYTDPKNAPPMPPPPPPPEVIKTQMQIQADQATMQLQLQADQQKTAAQLQADGQRTQAEMAHKERIVAAELQTKRDIELARMAHERELKAAEMAHQERRLGFDHAVATTSAILDDKKIETDAAIKAQQLQAENARTQAEHAMRQTELAHTAQTSDREFGLKAQSADREHDFKVKTTPGATPAPVRVRIELLKDGKGRTAGAREHFDDGSTRDTAIGHAPAQAQ
jgi:hypothetical protein